MFNVRSFAMALMVTGSLAVGGFLLATTATTAAGRTLAPVPSDQAVSAHAPFLAGQCGMCHDSSVSADASPGGVPADEIALCTMCHGNIGQKIKNSSVAHAPALMNCTACHNPHNARAVSLLVDEPKNLCLSCHSEIQRTITEAAVQHEPVVEGVACLNCHTPHGSDVRHLLADLPFNQCVACHSQEDQVGPDGRPRTNFSRLLAENPHRHGPVAGDNCSICHLTHGSEHHSLLVAEYPERFYAPYERENYELCFRCHSEENMLEPRTTTTRFRDGSRNLHYLHVNKPERGRTCRACHEVHASKNPHHIRDAVPFGPRNWMLPVNFTKTDTGGSCARTCHQTESYDYTKTQQ